MKATTLTTVVALAIVSALGCNRPSRENATRASEPGEPRSTTVETHGAPINANSEPSAGQANEQAEHLPGAGRATPDTHGDHGLTVQPGAARGAANLQGGTTTAQAATKGGRGMAMAARDGGLHTSACGAASVTIHEGSDSFCALACRGDEDCPSGESCTGQGNVAPMNGVGGSNGLYCTARRR